MPFMTAMHVPNYTNQMNESVLVLKNVKILLDFYT